MNGLILSAVLGVVMMFSGIMFKKSVAIRRIAVTGMLLVLVAFILEIAGYRFFDIDTSGMMQFDRFALIFNVIVAGCILIFFILSSKEIAKVGANESDYYALIFFIFCGIALASSFRSLLILFLGIEIISIPLYILTGSDKRNLKSNEASLKYFLMGAFSTGIMLMGIALLYGSTGTFDTDKMAIGTQAPSVLVLGGILLLMFSMSFKVSAAPFHFWTPDVYDGAPTVFTSFMATVVKVGSFVAFIRLFDQAFGNLRHEWALLISIIAAITLFIGNITAVFQQSVKRMLAYSSISQAGFMMLAVFALNSDAKEGLLLYAASYSLATIGIFAVLAKFDDYTFEGFNGFARKQPLLAATLVIFLLSLAGIPLTSGFLAKFYMLRATLAEPGNTWLVIFAVLMAAVSVYYYFRVIQAMYFREGVGQSFTVTRGFKITMVGVAALIILLGLFPNWITYWMYF